MTASVSQSESPAQIAWPLAGVSSVVGRNVFYNNSRFDGDDPSANAADDAAIATDKSALLPGETATFANYTSYRAGINGVNVDIAGLSATPTAADFIFRIGNDDDPSTWSTAPAPASITARPGAGLGGSTRVSIVWSDGAIANTWLQVTVRATSNTGLTLPDVFYLGNAIGESGNSSANALVNVSDQSAVRTNPHGLADPVSIFSVVDYDRDGLVGPADEIIARNFGTFSNNALRLVAPGADFVWTDVIARMVFYNRSGLDGNDEAANSLDDGAIATDKTALVDGGTATFANYTSYSGGINGIMVDMAGLSQSLSAADFEFRVGNGNDPAQWTLAPAPNQIVARFGAGQGGSTRVTIVWPDNAIQKQWLQVRVKATARTGLTADDVFYFGNAIGETGDSAASASVGMIDQLRVRGANGASNVTVSTPFDVNRDLRVDATDEQLVAGNYALGSAALKLVKLTAPAIDPAPSDVAEPAFSDFSNPKVVWRGVFYNNSGFDGESPAAGAPDDRAIAVDKSALLPGQTASYVNYTSYSRGINGIMIDVAGLPGDITADDFVFRVGNLLDVGVWLAASRPTEVTVRQGAGVGGSARITITWPDGAIQNQWLEVTLKATQRTGLKSSDVFYFGNLLGESVDSGIDVRVNVQDQALARFDAVAQTGAVSITAVSDHNRDTLVDGADEWIAARGSAALATLRLFTAPAAMVVVKPEREQIELFNRGDAGYNVFFAPTLVKTASGAILAIAEGRYGEDDHTSYALVMRKSLDGGATWSAITTITSVLPQSGNYIGNPAPVVDATTGRVLLLFCKNTDTVFVTSTGDDGLTWSAPLDITSSVKVTSAGNPNPEAFPSTPWGWYATGPGHGIQVQSGPYAGRLIIGSDHRLSSDRSGPSWSHVIYSDDHGLTWHLGGGVDQQNQANDYSNECSIVEQSNGTLYMSIRLNDGSSVRAFSRSNDGGATWTPLARDARLTTYGVEASLLRVNANTVLLSAPDSSDGTRRQMSLWVSHDDMVTWTKTKTVFYGYSGYSDMVLIAPDTVLLAYNRGHANGNSWQAIGLARVTLSWLESSSDPYQFTWHFNEKSPGEQANIEGTSLQDVGPWDARAQAMASGPEQAPYYVAGPGGHTALALTSGSDGVMLTPSATRALQFAASDSFTIELVVRTTDSLGVVLGSRAGVKGWSLQLLGGVPKFMMSDSQFSPTVSGSAPINDGLWHRIAVVRNATTRRLTMYVDDRPAVQVTDTTVQSLQTNEEIWLGSYNDGSDQVAIDVDTLRVTRTALPGNSLITLDEAEPPRFPAPVFGPGAPDTLGGLQFWLPAYDPTRYFGNMGFSDPVPLAPVLGTAVHSAIDASPNQFQVSVVNEMRQVLYADDSIVGPSWRHSAFSAGAGEEWTVHDSNGTSPRNFDFVQNTGVFTLSTFIKADAFQGASMALFDTAQTTSAFPGFSLLLTPNGGLTMLIVGPSSTLRLSQNSAPGLVTQGVWYHVAVVGRGPGNPITFYLTPVTAATVVGSTSGQVIAGENGNYATDANHNLTIGSLANTGQASFNGQMVDQAIYNRALSQSEIQQLFDYTKQI